jgi:hypothetical protein
MQRAEHVVQPPGPPVHHRAELAAYGQHQVGIRPAVIFTGGVRAGEPGTGYGVVGLGAGEEQFLDAVPFSDREHASSP